MDLKVIALYPGVNKEKNDVAQMLIELSTNGVELSIITSRTMVQKGIGILPPYEVMNGIAIHRLFNKTLDMLTFSPAKLKECIKITADLKPDLIFCSHEYNMRLALALQKVIKVPIVLLVEDAGRIKSAEVREPFTRVLFRNFLMSSLGVPIGRRFWGWLCKNASAIITCHPRDIADFKNLSEFGNSIYFLPWPTYLPPDFQQPLEKKKYRGIYVGSLYPAKNTQEFEIVLPRILKETPTQEFLVIGPGPHAQIIQALQRETNGAVKHMYGVSRNEALRLIGESFYAYTPVVVGGWGFIGDCWSVKTPLVMSHNDNYVVNNVNALVSSDCDSLISNINRLYNNGELCEALRHNGFEESKKRTAKAVADRLCEIFQKTLTAS